MPKKDTARNNRRTKALCDGYALVECLIAILVLSILSAALIGNLAQSESFSVEAENQLLSAAIVQSALERARHLTYCDLQKIEGEQHLPINNESDLGQLFGQYNCLLLDRSSNGWSETALKGAFKGELLQKVEPGDDPNSLRVIITCQWKEAGGLHKCVASTIVNRQGLQQ